MGIVSAFKKAISVARPKEDVALSLSDAPSFLKSLEEERLARAKAHIIPLAARLEDAKQRLSLQIGALDRAQLKNEGIPPKVKQVMQGNRNIYVQRLQGLVERLSPLGDMASLSSFCSEFDAFLDGFVKSTARSHYIMQECFVNEAGAIGVTIHEIDKMVKHIETEVRDAGIERIRHAKVMHREITDNIKERELMRESVDALSREISLADADIRKTQEEFASLRKSEGFRASESIRKSIESLLEEKKQARQAIINMFSGITPALRKYGRQSFDGILASSYADDPVEALLSDEGLQIAAILEKMREAVEKDSLSFRDRKKGRILRDLASLGREALARAKMAHGDAEEKADEMSKELSGIPEPARLKELQEIVERLTQKKEQKEKRCAEAREAVAKASIAAKIEGLSRELSELSGKTVILSWRGLVPEIHGNTSAC
ncbi:TPA: hypothetical protein HA361_01685 [Candidatus Woesearchaeota archaeon]|nr:hypothetical protein [Candidatus Woesearchaeota archaeon]HII69546.1 hypothetical protein [Candidatus Woesearchaeota archaeon]